MYKTENRLADFERIVSDYSGKIKLGVASLIENLQDAEDIVSDVYLGIWVSLPVFRRLSATNTWVYGIVRHKVNDYLRGKYKQLALVRALHEGEKAALAASRVPEREALPKIRSLTPAEFVVMRMVCLNLPNEEIARRLFRSKETIRTHIQRMYRKTGTKSRVELFNLVSSITDINRR